MSIYEQLLNVRKTARPALQGVLESIAEEAGYFLSPRGRKGAKGIADVLSMISPVSAMERSGSAMSGGEYTEAMVEVAGVLLPAAIVARYGTGTALQAAKAIQETLTGTGDSMGQIGSDVYEKFITRMNLPGEMPTVGSNFGNLSGRNRRSKTITMPDGTRVTRPTTMADVPNIRDMDVDDAIALARQEPHIIDAGESSRGAYIGGPENIRSRRSLNAQRKFMDAQIDAGAMGGDWYDRYRAGVDAVTNDANDATWMSNIEGMYSAGVSPEGELGFSLKDTNSAIAYGSPVKAARPAQKEASDRAIAANDETLFQLGAKTGEYARRINPAAAAERTATGVNDFRHARTLGFTEVSGEAQRNAIGAAGHKYSDYETALAVDRANQRALAGRTDWTGEQIQAAPWVKQKADDFYARYEGSYLEKAEERLAAMGSNMAPGSVEEMARQIALEDANRTITDFFPKHTAFATYEAQPFIDAGQLPGLADAPETERIAFANMPESTWANTGGRDDIYANTRLGDTGYAVRTLPTNEMQGVYTPPEGVTEYNPGEVARPLVAFDAGKVKSVPDADRAILDAGEATRAFVDVQGAGAWHKPWVGGQAKQSNSIYASLPTERPLTKEELDRLQAIGEKYGLPDVVDTGQGATVTSFYPEPKELTPKEANGIIAEINEMDIFSQAKRAKVDSGYLGFEEAWAAGEGSGEATRNLLLVLDGVPAGVYDAFNANEKIAENALKRLQRDEKLSAKYGATREDIANAREIIGEGKGWIDRLRAALKAGVILPGIAAFALGQSMSLENPDDEA